MLALKDNRHMPPKRKINTKHYSGRIAARVRALREERGWLVGDLAAALNRLLPPDDRVAVSTVHHWDNGGRNLPPDLYPFMAKVFGLTIAEFLPPK